MSYLKFDKSELVNLEYSLLREFLVTNDAGGYLNTTIIGCNTRKYHGLFVLPIEQFEGRRYVLLSSMDETLIQQSQEFHLGIRCYGKNHYEPRGHKYIVDCKFDKTASIEYMVGGMHLRKSILFMSNKERMLIKYTLLDANSPTTLRLTPFLAYREIHTLTRENDGARTNFDVIENGAAFNMYEGFPDVNIQLDKKNDYVHRPYWYNNVSYMEEQRRGFDYQEDLLAPGYFELPLKKGESVIVSVSTAPVSPKGMSALYTKEENNRIPISSFDDCLRKSAKQMIFSSQKGLKEIYSGYTWLGKGLRETMLALAGVTLYADGNEKTFRDILDSAFKIYSKQIINGSKQVEAALLIFWVLQQYAEFTGDDKTLWTKYKTKLKAIIQSFVDGTRMGVHMNADNGMLWAKMNGVAMTWMNAYNADGNPITERGGFQVEVNAFWYNAVCYMIEMGERYGSEKKFTYCLQEIKEKIEANFHRMFWIEERQHLADYVDEAGQNIFTRPNQIIACALPYSPISEQTRAYVMEAVKRELLTVRGIRTLSPKNPLYKGVYNGDQEQRDQAYHQGSTRVWLLSFYVEAMLKLYGDVFKRKAKELIDAFEEDIAVHGVASICELYDGDPAHSPHGAIASSVATAALLRSEYLINK